MALKRLVQAAMASAINGIVIARPSASYVTTSFSRATPAASPKSISS